MKDVLYLLCGPAGHGLTGLRDPADLLIELES